VLETICSNSSAVHSPDDGHKNARNMLSYNWLNNSLFIASCWSRLSLLSASYCMYSKCSTILRLYCPYTTVNPKRCPHKHGIKPPQWATTAIASPKPTTTLNHMNLDHTFPSYFFRIPFILSSHLLSAAHGLFPLGFPTKTLYTCVFSPTHATCSTHLTSLDMVMQMNTSTDNIHCSSHIKQYHYISKPKSHTYFQSL
jgi:hypothetical protein